MLVNSTVAKALYDNDISINANWSYAEYTKDTWKICNEDSENFIQYAAPDVMDVIKFFLDNGIFLRVVLDEDHFSWVINFLNEEDKTLTGFTEESFIGEDVKKSYEETIQQGLMECIKSFKKEK